MERLSVNTRIQVARESLAALTERSSDDDSPLHHDSCGAKGITPKSMGLGFCERVPYSERGDGEGRQWDLGGESLLMCEQIT